MFVRRLVPLVLVLGLFAGCGGGGDESTGNENVPVGVAGDWTGTLQQKGIPPFQVAVRLDAAGSGRVAYTGIECGGTWTAKRALASAPPFITINERITEGAGGKCKGVGTVTLHPSSSASGGPMQYAFRGGGVTSRGLLHRTDPAGIDSVFEEAGVTPP
jgi:hypothetical protein